MEKKKEKLNVAVIGLGDTGVIHANAYMNNPCAEVRAVCDSSRENLERFVKGPWKWAEWLPESSVFIRRYRPEQGIEKIYRDYREVADDPSIDAVSICLPDVLHSRTAVAMLGRKKHVLIEKPMAGSGHECMAMIDAARASNVKLQIAHMWRFHPEVKFIKNVIDSGKLGKIVKTKGYAVYVRSAPTGWFLQKKFAVGGALLSVGIHAIDTVRYFLNDPAAVSVYAKVDTVYGDYDVDDMAVVVIEFSNGTVSIIESGQNHPYADGPEACTQLFGTKGYARVFPAEAQYKTDGRWNCLKPDRQVLHIYPKMFQDEVDHFIECIMNDKKPVVDGETAMENVRIVEAAYRSSREGKIIYLEKE
jgi:predicted dehydrogenase